MFMSEMESMSNLKVKWEDNEVKTMLGIVREMNLVALLDQEESRSEVLYKEVEKQLTAKGYKKSFQQIHYKVKALWSTFNKIVRLHSVGGAAHITCDYYDELDEIFGHHPDVDYTNMGVDTGITNAVSLDVKGDAASTTETSFDTSSNHEENPESGKRPSVDFKILFEKQREWEEKMMHEQMEAHAQLMRETVQQMGTILFACVSQLSKKRGSEE
uniref:uncharacterized protein LOC120337088 isoform X2 n=1 Tax=Styela clava TaxID=7725 RepID=UPI00193A990B|nr:uncharacterized protein LOC120337088 isoform X2 [Styela clava]